MSHKIRKFAIVAASRPTSDINITPLVDVVLVLLIIFMVVTPLLEKDIQVRVPSTEKQEDETPPPDDQLLVSIDKDGKFAINFHEVAFAEYEAKLKEKVDRKAAGDKIVFFMADDKANYAKVVAALDGARHVGAEVLGVSTEKLDAPSVIPPSTPDPAPAPAKK